MGYTFTNHFTAPLMHRRKTKIFDCVRIYLPKIFIWGGLSSDICLEIRFYRCTGLMSYKKRNI